MKLLHCLNCNDIVKIHALPRRCQCGRSEAFYVNDTHVKLKGNARAIGIDTGELARQDKGTWHESKRIHHD